MRMSIPGVDPGGCLSVTPRVSERSDFTGAKSLAADFGLIESCEHCNHEGAEIPFDNILDRVTGSDPSVTDYILEEPA